MLPTVSGNPGTARQQGVLPAGNSYGLMEWAGAFGDLGTLIPFVLAYITVLKMDPVGLLLTFGLMKIASGIIYKTPIPIQPMKAIGVSSTIQAGTFSPSAIWGAGFFTGLFWLVLGLTGMAGRLTALIKKPVTQGIMMGLGFSFMLEGIRGMQSNYVLSMVAMVLTLALIGKRTFPVMFLLMALGIFTSLLADPSLLGGLRQGIGFRLPQFFPSQLTWPDLVKGSLFLALPQIPLTLGNAVIAIVAENNELFPRSQVTEKKIAVSTGLMNLVSPLLGGVPMCHGAGGMAGHVRFGARTGGALVILGVVLVLIALFFGSGVQTIFQLFPPAVLGAILFFTGAELALAARPAGSRQDYFVTVIIAALSLWNIGAAFLAGLLLCRGIEKGWINP